MRDWSGALVEAERHSRKAQEALTPINAGVMGPYREALVAAAEEHLCEALKCYIDALSWVRLQR